MKKTIIPVALIAMVTASCAGDNQLKKASETITPAELREYTRILSADSMMGRKPFTPGETITINYLAGELERTGFAPAFGDSWFQEVPMVEINTTVQSPVLITAAGRKLEFSVPDDIALKSPSMKEYVELVNIPMVFCGFGIVAPEYGWNDFSVVDVRGKCAVVLVNDPGLYTGDSALFKGRTMTYYGRWRYKYEEAARQGATAILIIHETVGAGYDFSIPRKSSILPGLYQEPAAGDPEPCPVTGWLSAGAASELFGAMGHDVEKLRGEACVRGFAGFEMGASISLRLTNTHRRNSSMNVAGILRGTTRPEEAIVISAHWDHFGIGEKENGDSIYNGAVDNSTSMAWALEIGEAFSSMKKRPQRSVILFFPTAEEQGLIGSSWFVANPPVKQENLIACFNNDLLLPIGRMKDVMVTGYGQSELDDLLADAARKQDRYILPDPNPESGMYFRSDHFPFARAGVPALFARGNCDSREYGREWAAEQENDFIRNRYHKPADNYYPEMNFDGIAEDARAILDVAFTLVTSDVRPGWKPGSEFANIK
ncbi:MAG TPA: M28 family peptidase [Bacteroidales bacterium]|jgi:Zn-dependent M28 family amino/carboxypeptidase|nr:M28 family peptidase [Bacteroidales bacterium]MBK7731294.1 M28 family peptidase [Bacteroidales bacterium]MBP7036689.1 M28 family peptidase [Bacteroidales bacterium]MBP8709409.1 M28 family peptidase [Bacteroidales bacterium]MZQ79188.1 M28 family peptidase [Bacteroidales bacterium]